MAGPGLRPMRLSVPASEVRWAVVGAAIGSGVGKAFAGWINTKTHGLFR